MSAQSIFRKTLTTPEATDAFGEHLGRHLGANAIVALCGELGAGKTRLCRAICAGLDVPNLAAVNSPTYVLIQEYRGRLSVYHFDTYRLTSAREFLELGVEEYFTAGGVCLIEWADRVAEYLPHDRLTITLSHLGPTTRELVLEASGPISQQIFTLLAE